MVFGFRSVFPVDKLGQDNEAKVIRANPNHWKSKISYVRRCAMVPLTTEVDSQNNISSKT